MFGFGFGEALTGIRMIGAGLAAIFRWRGERWSAANVSARLGVRHAEWIACEFQFSNERPFVLEVISVRSLSPRRLRLAKSKNELQPVAQEQTASDRLAVGWQIAAATHQPTVATRTLFVERPHKPLGPITFELSTLLHNNRRQRFPVLVRAE
jgi:hypothetical protein